MELRLFRGQRWVGFVPFIGPTVEQLRQGLEQPGGVDGLILFRNWWSARGLAVYADSAAALAAQDWMNHLARTRAVVEHGLFPWRLPRASDPPQAAMTEVSWWPNVPHHAIAAGLDRGGLYGIRKKGGAQYLHSAIDHLLASALCMDARIVLVDRYAETADVEERLIARQEQLRAELAPTQGRPLLVIDGGRDANRDAWRYGPSDLFERRQVPPNDAHDRFLVSYGLAPDKPVPRSIAGLFIGQGLGGLADRAFQLWGRLDARTLRFFSRQFGKWKVRW